MKKIILMAAGAAVAAASIPAAAFAAPAPRHGPAAFEQGWQNINARQARIEMKINQGIRSGALTRREAVQLRTEFRQIERLEAKYRQSRPGLTTAERRDLDRRMDLLERKIFASKTDRDRYYGGRRH